MIQTLKQRKRIGFFIAAVIISYTGYLGMPNTGAQAAANATDGIYSDAQAARGENQYMANCIACHGTDLAGVEDTPGLANADFRKQWDGQTIYALVSFIQTQMPADRPGSLSQDAATDIAAFLLKRNGFPSGSSELPTDATAESKLTFKATK